jgi:hypothetical protein
MAVCSFVHVAAVKNGKRHAYWALVESQRTANGPRQRIIGYLGALPGTFRKGVKNADFPLAFQESPAYHSCHIYYLTL